MKKFARKYSVHQMQKYEKIIFCNKNDTVNYSLLD
jgi:hypothetical protein